MREKAHFEVSSPYNDDCVLVEIVRGEETLAWCPYNYLDREFESLPHFKWGRRAVKRPLSMWYELCKKEGLEQELNHLIHANLSYAFDEEAEEYSTPTVAAVLQRAVLEPFVESGRFVPFELGLSLSNLSGRALSAAAICDEMDRYTAENPLLDFGVKLEHVGRDCTVHTTYSVYSAGCEYASWEFWRALGSPAPGAVEFGAQDGKHLAARYMDADGFMTQVTFVQVRPNSMAEKLLNGMSEEECDEIVKNLFETESEQMGCEELLHKLERVALSVVRVGTIPLIEPKYVKVAAREGFNETPSIFEDVQQAANAAYSLSVMCHTLSL